MTSALARLDALDLRLYRRAAWWHAPALDRVLPRLTCSADHGLLWAGIGAGLALSGGGRRRAAVRGVASLAVASATANLPANLPAKLAARRDRPQLQSVPLPRQLLRQPTSTSFPSGHSAAAAAFAVGVAIEQPWLAPPVGLLAAGVAYGRVHTGVHYPGDVLAGVVLGVASALLVRRVWPVRPDVAAVALHASIEAPARPDGDGLVIVVNERAGAGHRAKAVEQTFAGLLPKAELVRCTGGADLTACLTEAAGRATVLGVMGGDGTVNQAAGIALGAGLPLVVLPGGTLHHSASAEFGAGGLAGLEDIVEAVPTGSAVRVAVGSAAVDGKGLYFLKTFAVGVYPELVRAREQHEQRIGKWPAIVLALARVLRHAESVRVEVDGQDRRLWTLFAGNGHDHPAGFASSWRARLDDGCIDGRLPVRSSQGGQRIARDGQVGDGPVHLLLRAAEHPLVVYRPVSG